MELNQNRRKTRTKNKYVSANHTEGITLIALVITIIVLLILAGISIAMLTGDNGILKKASTAKEKTNKETATEIIKLKITDLQMKIYDKEQRTPTLQELADAFCEDNEIAYVNIQKKDTAKINDKIEIGENTKIYTKLEAYPYEFEIGSDLQIAKIDGEEMIETDLADKTPDGYIKPEGTISITENGEHDVTMYGTANVNVPTYTPKSNIRITEKSAEIDVSQYQYADTTALYTESEIQSGKGIYWESTTVTFPTNGNSMTIDLGFIPNFIFIKAIRKNNTNLLFYSDNNCVTFSSYNIDSNQYNPNTTYWEEVDGQLKFTVNEGSANLWYGADLKIFAVK